MAAGYFRERRRLAAVFVVGGLAAMAVVLGALWKLSENAGGGHESWLVVAFALAGIVAGLALIWVRLDRTLLYPLERLERELDTLLHADPKRAVDLVEPGLLGPVIARMERLFARADRSRQDLAASIAAATAALESDRSKLATILHELPDGVVVCSADHRILLFNAAARQIVANGDRLGVGQPVDFCFDRETVASAFDRVAAGVGRDILLIDLPQTGPARIAAWHGKGGDCEGYVLTIVAEPNGGEAKMKRLAYDFGISGRPVEETGGDVKLSEATFVVFGILTTGLRPDRGDRILRIGAVRVSNGKVREEEVFETLVNPGRPVPPSSTRLHGLTDEIVADAPDTVRAIASFHAYCGDAVLVAQHAGFDMRFLRNSQQEAGVEFPDRFLDPMLLSFVLHPGESDHSLAALARRYGVDIAGPHTLNEDVRGAAEILCRMAPLLAASGIETVDQAIEACRKSIARNGKTSE